MQNKSEISNIGIQNSNNSQYTHNHSPQSLHHQISMAFTYILHGNLLLDVDPTAMAIPFSGASSGTGGVITSVSSLGPSILHNSNPLCNAISQTTL